MSYRNLTLDWTYDVRPAEPDADQTKVLIQVPKDMTLPEIDELEERFALLIKQLRRLANESP